MGAIARRPDHRLFDLAWDEVAIDGDGSAVAALVAHAGGEHAERALDFLIRASCHRTGDYMTEAWTTVFRLAPDEATLRRWLDKVGRCLPAILDDVSDLGEWLGGTEYLATMALRLPGDMAMRMAVRGTEGDPVPVDLQRRVQRMEVIVDGLPPRLAATCIEMRRRLDAWGVGSAVLLEKLDRRREENLAECDRIRAAWGGPEFRLEGWVGPS